MRNSTDNLQNSLAVSYKTNLLWPYDPAIIAHWYSSKEGENSRPHKKLHTDVYTSFIHNCQNSEATKMLIHPPSFSRWMDKLWDIWIMEYYSVLKMKELSNDKTWRKFKMCITTWKEPIKKTTYYMFPTAWHSGESKTMKIIRWMTSAGLVGSKMEGKYGCVKCRIFWAAVWCYNGGHMSLYTSPNPKNVQHWEWTIMETMVFGWLCCANIDYLTITNVPCWYGMLTIGKAMHVQEHRNLCIFLLILFEPKTVLTGTYTHTYT